jgi:hypothetical protein
LASIISLFGEDFEGDAGDHSHLGDRGVSFLRERRDVLEANVLSKMWYMAQILPLAQAMVCRATNIAKVFLWVVYRR